MLYVLRNGLQHSSFELPTGPVLAELIDEPQIKPVEPPPPPPMFQPVRLDPVPEPEIAIDLPPDSGQAITLPAAPEVAASPARSGLPEIIPPRIDQNRSEMMPMYPPTSKRLGEQGRVLLMVHVLADGKPAEVQLERSSGFDRLDQAAVAHVLRAWHFVPARSGSRAIDFWGEFAVTFRITQ
jgi:protein TonB